MGIFLENGIFEFLYSFLLFFWFVYLYFVKDYGYWEERQVPHVPAVFPFGSMSKTVLGRTYLGVAIDKIYREFKKERYVGFIEVRRPCLMIGDPDLIKRILQDDFNYFTDHIWVETNPKEYMTNNLFNMRGQEWKEMRAKLTPVYAAAKMKMMFGLVKQCGDLLQQALKKRTETSDIIDVKDILNRFTIDFIASCAFGIEVNSLSNENAEFYCMGLRAMQVNYRVLLAIYLFNAFPIFSKCYCIDFTHSDVKEFMTNIIHKTIDYREKNNISRCDFLDVMIKLKKNESILEGGEKTANSNNHPRPGKREGMTIEQITAETFLFFVAGYETISNTILFCLYELACNPEIQDTLSQEVEKVLDGYDSQISYQALQEMTYMDQVINETLRRYPLFPTIMRNCTEVYRVPGSTLVLEKSLKVVIPVYSLHHDPEYFPDPYTFNPDRFSAENSKKRHPYVFLPFGAGPRNCIGIHFGLIQVKSALATILSDYKILPTPETEVPLRIKGNCFLTTPLKTVKLAFKRRRDNES